MSVLKPERRRTYLPAADRRAQILERAKGVFARRGYHKANVAQICAAAGIGRGTLYQYFDNKRAVLLALLGEIAGRIRHVLATRVAIADLDIDLARLSAANVAAFCQGRMREVLDTIFRDEKTLRLVLREARGLDSVVEKVIAQIDDLLLTAIEKEIRAGQKLGVLRDGNARLHARLSLGGIEKVVLTALSSGEPIDLDVLVREAVHVQLFGLMSRVIDEREAGDAWSEGARWSVPVAKAARARVKASPQAEREEKSKEVRR
jgi:TetR/AcrR family fatty acid metabolism transcriptional regulator